VRCCSSKCDRVHDCGLHYSNSLGVHQIEDFSTCGSGGISDPGNWWCGSLGNYKMFEPIRYSKEEFIRKHCNICGRQSCLGPGSDAFYECRFKNQLN
jgi:hypothetical protein